MTDYTCGVRQSRDLMSADNAMLSKENVRLRDETLKPRAEDAVKINDLTGSNHKLAAEVEELEAKLEEAKDEHRHASGVFIKANRKLLQDLNDARANLRAWEDGARKPECYHAMHRSDCNACNLKRVVALRRKNETLEDNEDSLEADLAEAKAELVESRRLLAAADKDNAEIGCLRAEKERLETEDHLKLMKLELTLKSNDHLEERISEAETRIKQEAQLVDAWRAKFTEAMAENERIEKENGAVGEWRAKLHNAREVVKGLEEERHGLRDRNTRLVDKLNSHVCHPPLPDTCAHPGYRPDCAACMRTFNRETVAATLRSREAEIGRLAAEIKRLHAKVLELNIILADERVATREHVCPEPLPVQSWQKTIGDALGTCFGCGGEVQITNVEIRTGRGP